MHSSTFFYEALVSLRPKPKTRSQPRKETRSSLLTVHLNLLIKLLTHLFRIILIPSHPQRRNRKNPQLELPLLIPKETRRKLAKSKTNTKRANTPPNHNPKPLNPLQIQRPNIIHIPPAIRSPQIRPLDKKRAAPLISPEIIFPANRATLPPIRAPRQNLVFQRQRVGVAVTRTQNQF